ncbi:GumC family protein [Candidatus Nitrospira allomarina]|jgi:uncharacterized protein involved in exopolysaccharide biosynthesis|uniref:GumC family protein n=1 Tax=Candidatus Nitrospira allomarina TaxID=3020900 RepID=A0AA96GAJ6_9BACT|nr:GumC family protein [Candidatus Nitrospira allomarina]WNM57981.1 GumC family protein [Candidatus Nitrospira allomarina]
MSTHPSQSSRHNHEIDYFSIRDILTILFKHRYEIIAIFVFFTIISLIISMKMTPIYRAESSLMVKVGREHMYSAEVGDQNPKMVFDLETLIDPEITILTSRDLSRKVVEAIGVKNLYPEIFEENELTISPLEAALINFSGNLSVTRSGKSNVILVNFEHAIPEIAARAVNLLGEFWKEKHLAIFSNPQASFLEDQVETFREKLEQSETVLQDFKRENRISSLLDQRALLLEQRQNLDSRLKSNEDEVKGLGSKIFSIRDQLKDIAEYIPIMTVNEQLHQRIAETRNEYLALKRKEQQFLGKYQESSRIITDIREEIALIQASIQDQEEQLKDQVTRGRNPVFQDLQLALLKTESEVSSLNTKQEVILRQIKEVDTQIVHLNALEKQFDALQREVHKDQENLRMYVEKFEMAHVSTEMDNRQMANVSVIQTASIPIQPIKPNKSFILCFGIVLGMLSGTAWAFVAEFFKGGYTRPEQASLEQGIPVLTSIRYKS